MNAALLNRQLGAVGHQDLARTQHTTQLESLQLYAKAHFSSQQPRSGSIERPRAHNAGVTSIEIDRFEGRYLVSGGADSSLTIWDLESPDEGSETFSPLLSNQRTSSNGTLGITHVSFYPFDSGAVLTSGYDRTLKLFSSETLQASATFDIGSIVYSHATSPVSDSLLVACASEHPAVRLVDLRSGANIHGLAGHAGAVITVAWHPRSPHILASGATDGAVRLWDVRRSASSLGVLDLEDSTGVSDAMSASSRRQQGRAHTAAVNGLTWTDDGTYLLSNGHDERMRVWNMQTGANTLANFGPGLKNGAKTLLAPLLAPSFVSPAGRETVVYPNPRELLVYDVRSGMLQARLRVPLDASSRNEDLSGRNAKNRTTALAWRAHHVEVYSAHGDGMIRCWRPRTLEDRVADEEELHEEETDIGIVAAERKRKREELNDIVNDLMKKKITFT